MIMITSDTIIVAHPLNDIEKQWVARYQPSVDYTIGQLSSVPMKTIVDQGRKQYGIDVPPLVETLEDLSQPLFVYPARIEVEDSISAAIEAELVVRANRAMDSMRGSAIYYLKRLAYLGYEVKTEIGRAESVSYVPVVHIPALMSRDSAQKVIVSGRSLSPIGDKPNSDVSPIGDRSPVEVWLSTDITSGKQELCWYSPANGWVSDTTHPVVNLTNRLSGARVPVFAGDLAGESDWMRNVRLLTYVQQSLLAPFRLVGRQTSRQIWSVNLPRELLVGSVIESAINRPDVKLYWTRD